MTVPPALSRNVHGQLHLRMDAAENQVRPGLRKRDLDGLARLLRAGVEVELRVEHANVVVRVSLLRNHKRSPRRMRCSAAQTARTVTAAPQGLRSPRAEIGVVPAIVEAV